MNIKVKTINKEKPDISYKEIVDLIHESFQERLKQGLHYSCSYITERQFVEKTKNGIVFIAIDTGTNTLVGTSTLNIHVNKGIKYGYMEYVAIRSNNKHSGIGTQLICTLKEKAKKNECAYILSDTSTKATSAVRYHLKNGFKIIGLESYRSTNYWSYVFRMQIAPSRLWHNSLFLKFHYWNSYVFIKLTRNIDGTDTRLGFLYKRIKKLCKN